MLLDKNSQTIRVAMVVKSADDPSEAAEMAITLTDLQGFEVRIVGCGMPSVFDCPLSAPMMGIPMPSFAMEQYKKAGQQNSEFQNKIGNFYWRRETIIPMKKCLVSFRMGHILSKQE